MKKIWLQSGPGLILLKNRAPVAVHTFRKIADLVQSLDKQIADEQRPVHQLLYDSRLISNGQGGLFFAFPGTKNDGHLYISDVAKKGVNQWIISDRSWAGQLEKQGDQNWILVADVLDAFQVIIAWHRGFFELPVIGITGSNGKTIVKEWLSQLIGFEYFVCKSPKSFNSQIGVGLSVWNLAVGHTLGLFEAGISRPGEMEKLERMIRPSIGIFTNLGTAHDDGFKSTDQKLDEKLLLFVACRQVVVQEELYNRFKERLLYSHPTVDWLCWNWVALKQPGKFQLHFQGKKTAFQLPFQDKASLENLGHAISTCLLLGVKPVDIQERLQSLSQPEMRLSIKEGQNGCTLIDDSYTNDLEGLEAALQFAGLQRKANQKLVVVLSAQEQRGISISQLSIRLLYLVSVFEVNELHTIGIPTLKFPTEHSIKLFQYEEVSDLLRIGVLENLSDALILIKGSRKYALENVVKAWQKKVHGTRLEINLDALVHNLNFYKSQLPPKTGIMAMVKALGYGSGGEEIARLLQYHRVDYLAVAYADEGIKLRQEGISLPIMVMNPMPEAMPSLLIHNLQPEIYSFRTLEGYLETIRVLKPETIPPVHIKIDTGMHRLGFFPEEVPSLIHKIKQHPEIQIETVFSHLAGADEEQHTDYTLLQLQRFEEACLLIQQGLNQSFKRHLVNSAGIIRFPRATFDLVRLGIGLYGIEVNSWYQNQLRPVSVLKTTVSQIKSLRSGETVGYSRKGKLLKDSTIATIALGYADGFSRDFSNGNGLVKIKNQWVPTVGNVCMDMTMVDVSGLDVEEGEEVTIFDDADSLLRLASAAHTISYEILTGIGHRVKRVFYRE